MMRGRLEGGPRSRLRGTRRRALPLLPALPLALVLLLALVLAGVAAAIALAPVSAQTLRLGPPGVAHLVSGFSLASDHLGTTGRWTRGDGLLTLPAYPAPALITLRVATPAERAPDTVEIIVNDLHARRVTLGAGWTLVSVPAAPAMPGEPLTVRLRSAVTSTAGSAPRGLFVDRVTLATGGLASLRQTPPRTWGWLALAFLGLIAFAWRASAAGDMPASRAPASRADSGTEGDADVHTHGDAGVPAGVRAGNRRSMAAAARAAAIVGGCLLLACLGVILFRPMILAQLVPVAAICWTLAIGAALAEGRAGARLGAASTRRVAVVFLLGAIALFALLFPDAVFHGQVLSQAQTMLEIAPWRNHAPADYRAGYPGTFGDVSMMVYPFAVFTQTRWWEGVFPLWTSQMSSGQPFFATYQAALLSPFSLVLALVPLPSATVVIVALRLLVGGLGMFLFLRAIGLSRWAAAFGGVAFQLNPVTQVWLEHPLASVHPWLPWLLLAGERLATGAPRVRADAGTAREAPHQDAPPPARPHRAGAVLMLALVTAFAFVGGHPHSGLYVALLGAAYAAARALAAPDRWRALALATAAMALGAALAAVQVLPFLEYLSLSRTLTERAAFTLNPFYAPIETLITALVPNFLGNHAYGNFAGPGNYLEQQIYPGLVVWLLAPIGLIGGARAWRAWFFAAVAALALLVFYAAPGVHQLVSTLPMIKGASLTRVAIIGVAALAILASIGLDAILRADRSRRFAWLATGTLTLLTAALILILRAMLARKAAFLESTGLTLFVSQWAALAVWLAAALLFACASRLLLRAGRGATAFAIVTLLTLDLLLFGRGFRDEVPPAHVFPMVPEIAIVQRDPALFRVMGLGMALLPNTAMAYGLQDVRGYDGLLVARYADLLDAVLRYQLASHLAERASSPLINLLNVKYVFGTPNVSLPDDGWFTKLTEGDAPLYRNNRVLPRAFLVDGYTVRDGNLARRTLRDGLVDFRRVGLLEADPPEAERPEAASSPDNVGAAEMVSYRDQRVEIQTDAPARRLLILSDVHYPGWRATIDGQPAPIHRANFAFRAVPVPAGRHRVVFEYRPDSFRRGLAISLTAAALLAALAWSERRRARRGAR